jgi:hypothetical protein
VSTNGGVYPRWSPDGKELSFITDTTLMAAAMRVSGPAIEPGRPEPLFAMVSDRRVASAQRPYDVAPDGRFLVNVPLDSSERAPIRLLLNRDVDRQK